MLKRTLHFFIGVFCPLFLAAIKVDHVKLAVQNIFNCNAILAEWGFLTLVAVAMIANYIVTGFNPERKYQKAQEARLAILDEEANKFIEKFRKKKFNVQFNVMCSKKLWKIIRLEPNGDGIGTLKLFPKVFKFEWSSSNLEPNKAMILGINQGSSGISRKDGLKIFGLTQNSEAERRVKLNLNENQVKLIASINLLVSIPIKASEVKSGKRARPIIGILTMQCDDPALGTLMNYDEDSLNKLPNIKKEYDKQKRFITRTMVDFSDFYRKLYF